jgi:hypothetical protein
LIGSCQVNQITSGFDFPYFFLNPTRFQFRVDPLSQAGFQNYP